MREAAKEYGWKLNNAGIALMWRGGMWSRELQPVSANYDDRSTGCIIRSVFLKDITQAFRDEPELESLLFNQFFTNAIHKAQPGWRRICAQASLWGIVSPSLEI